MLFFYYRYFKGGDLLIKRVEKVEFMSICMIYDNKNVVVQERTKQDWTGIFFSLRRFR